MDDEAAPVARTNHAKLAQFESIIGSAGNSKCKYQKLGVIGRGSYGEAWKIRRVSDGVDLVAKVMDLKAMSKKDVKYAETEVQCLASCSHFACVRYVEDYKEGSTMLIIMEYADAGDLNMQVKGRASEGYRYFEEHEVAYTFVQAAMALDHIHRRKMLHRDIKGANVLLTTTGLIKIGDFGFSQMYEDTVSENVGATFCGTPYYLAPELWNHNRYSKKADMWALGVVLYEMMALKRPFVGDSMKKLMQAVVSGAFEPLPDKFSVELREVVALLLNPDPNQRPSTAQLFHLPAMKRVIRDFEKSVEASRLISEDTKKLLRTNIQEVKDTSPTDTNSGAACGKVGEVQTTVVCEGSVKKESAGGEWKDRYLLLSNAMLYISFKKGDDAAHTKQLALGDVAGVMPVPFHVSGLANVFAVTMMTEEVLWFSTAGAQECYEWIHRIQQALGVA